MVNSKTPEEKFLSLTELSDYWSTLDTTKALTVLRQAYPLTNNDPYLLGVYHFYEAGAYFGTDNKKSQQLYMLAEEYLKKVETRQAYRYRARLWHNYGVLEQYGDNERAFLDITLKYCIPFAQRAGDNDLLINYFANVGIVFYNNKEYDKATEYYDKAILLVQNPSDETENLLWVYLNKFEVYVEKGDPEMANDMLAKSRKLLEKFPTSSLAAVFYKNEARYFNWIGNPQKAIESIEKGMESAVKLNSQIDFFYLKYEKALVLRMMRKWAEAKTVFEELLADSLEAIPGKSKMTIKSELSKTEAQLGNYADAYLLLSQYKAFNDSVSILDFKQQLAEMETRYRTAEKEQEIQALENKDRVRNLLLMGISALLLILLLWILYAWNARKKRNKTQTLLLKQQREIEVSKALIDGEEQERKRLAQELHDGLVGSVIGIKLNVERLARESENEEWGTIVGQLDGAIVELRQTARNLAPVALLKTGLSKAITDFCASIGSKKVPVHCYVDGLESIEDKNIQSSVFRIVQELVTNAVRHAEASEIILQCTCENGLLLIEAEDNGKGFDVKNTPANMGLNNIRSRVKYLNGVVEIDSKPGEGTIITIECKLPNA
ncbi:MAG: sensor histidine kinase [Bacteroidia bacterium]|nr:sensor histidine kinase [Bacteroidia bacterium]